MRRRECMSCDHRFTTYEVQTNYDPAKMMDSLQKSIDKFNEQMG